MTAAGLASSAPSRTEALTPVALAWGGDVAPRLGIAGGVIGVILVNSTMPQVVKTSDGRMGSLTWNMWGRMAMRSIPKAGGMKFAQYGVMREMKLCLDKVISPPAATMISFGVVGTFFQSAIYNSLISDMYKVYTGVEKKRPSLRVLARGMAPGIVWCFGRECFSMGGGLWLGPVVKEKLLAQLEERRVEVPDKPLRFVSGFLSGACTAFGTQWLHNTTLMAGRMAAVGDARGAPFYTAASVLAAWNEMGVRMFYANYPQRLCLIAGAVGLLTMVDIFHRPELSYANLRQ
jgi:hypothetical protein